jgi:hypothetical protein
VAIRVFPIPADFHQRFAKRFPSFVRRLTVAAKKLIGRGDGDVFVGEAARSWQLFSNYERPLKF